MDEMIRHIEYLLITQDCVVIPEIGAIMAHTMTARADESKACIMPPRRVYSFDPSLNHNDGKLTASIARSKNIGTEEAANLVAEQGRAMKAALDECGELSVGKIGCIKSSGNTLSFITASTASSFTPSTMWLPQISLRYLNDIVKERQTLENIRYRQHGKGRILHFATQVGRVAASLALLVALGIMLTTPIDIENAQYASLGFENFKPVQNKTEKSHLIRRPGESTSPLVLVLNSHDDAQETVDTAAHNAYIRDCVSNKVIAIESIAVKTEDTNLRLVETDKYFVIVASLATQTDAETFIKDSGCENLGVLVKDGRYRVYAASGNSMQQVKDATQQLAEQFPQSWICRK